MLNVNTFIAEHTEDANNDEDENHFVDEDIEVNIDYSEGNKSNSWYWSCYRKKLMLSE